MGEQPGVDLFRPPRLRRFDWLDPDLIRPHIPPRDLPIRPVPIPEGKLPGVWRNPHVLDRHIKLKDVWRIPPVVVVPPIVVIPPPSEVPRHELTVPVAPNATPTDHDRFESPDAAIRYALPRYDVAFDRVGSAEEPRVHIVDRAGTATLVIGFSATPSPASGPNVARLPHTVGVTLKYRVPVLDGGSMVSEVPFPTVTLDDAAGVATAELPLTRAGLRQQLLAAMSTRDAAVTLVVRRGITVGVPTGGTINGRPAYRQTDLLLEWTAQPTPLLLSDAQRARLGGTGTAGVQPMHRIRLQHGARSHSYWQDPARPELFYFLPDRFQLARIPDGRQPPALRVLATSATREEDVRVTAEFLAWPVLGPGRLESAIPRLQDAARDRGATEPVRLELLPDPQPVLRLALPVNGAPSSALTERPDAQIDLEEGITHAETFTLEDFTLVREALFGASLSVLRGEVRVGTGGGPPEDVPLELRLEETAGDLLVLTPTQATPELVTARLANGVESPVRVDRLGAYAFAGGERVPMRVEGVAPGTVLDPDQDLEISLVPERPLPDAGAEAIMLEQSGVTVLLDRAAVWAAIFDDTARPHLTRRVTVEAVPGLFDGPADDRVAAFIVTVAGAPQSVKITEDEPVAESTVRLPLRELLRESSSEPVISTVRYQTQTIWRSGGIGVSPWRTTVATILIPVKTAPGATGDQ